MWYIQFWNTWWWEKFLDTLNEIDYSNRLPRWKSYARNWSVRKINIDFNKVQASVKWSRRSPYSVCLIFPEFKEKEKNTIINTIVTNVFHISKLLNWQLSIKLFDELKTKNINLFPRRWDDVNWVCSCPDWAVPCKHIASVIYLIANEIDKDPFVVFRIRGFDILEAIKAKWYEFKSYKDDIANVEDIFSEKDIIEKEKASVEKLLETIDFSDIKDIDILIFTLLTEKPQFDKKLLFAKFSYINIM